ncbi:zinc finger and BTB domain-containing protein 49 [Clonorchis sinensis]|uniref:Zinc finger and BTB domain-containing protein 49 n=1 Tax=Clonorchis sinensis TaxID=79923 RepID=H2KR89_CLOSI|nr:zinc finger and BTB domain-containing protein 49 [Clonorchis sinensis]
MKTLGSLVFTVTLLCFERLVLAQDYPTHGEETCKRTLENRSVTLGFRGAVGGNALSDVLTNAKISTKQPESPASSSNSMESVDHNWTNQCPVCRRVFRHPSVLRKHQISHTNYRGFECNICEKTYKESFNLVRHMRKTHVDEFLPPRRSSSAQIHASDEAGNPCPECGKQFKNWKTMRQHQKTIHLEAVHVCVKCGISFSRELHLKKHIRTMHELVDKCACPYCGKSFTRVGNLPKHIRNVHKREQADQTPMSV